MATTTLKKSMLDDLALGNASISLLEYVDGGVDLNGLDFTGADQLFTTQDTFQLTPDDPDTSEIKIDQLNETIEYSIEEGTWTFTGNVPSMSSALLAYFFDTTTDAVAVTGQDGTAYEGVGFGAAKEVEASILVESYSKKTAIIIGHVKMMANPPAHDDHQTPDYVKITGAVLTNGDYARFAVLKASTTTTAE